jgi:hypothetical protein
MKIGAAVRGWRVEIADVRPEEEGHVRLDRAPVMPGVKAGREALGAGGLCNGASALTVATSTVALRTPQAKNPAIILGIDIRCYSPFTGGRNRKRLGFRQLGIVLNDLGVGH